MNTAPTPARATTDAQTPSRLATYGGWCGCQRGGAAGVHAGRRLFTAALLTGAAAQAMAEIPECKRSSAAKLVPAAQVEASAQQQYLQLLQSARSKNALASPDEEQLQRLRYIAARIVPLTPGCNPRASEWRWDVQLLRSSQLNAFCMPGGKIAFFSGILSKLALSDDEVAIIMGHEVAHALLEHARERMAKSGAANIGLRLGAALLGLGQLGDIAAQQGAALWSLKFSRDDESEADALGLLLASRAGYDPRAGVSLWQKMGQANAGKAPPAWLSTHPAGPARIKNIEARLPRVMPMYQAADKPERHFRPAA